MIESRYWKEDLLNHAKRLKLVKKPRRWSERLVGNFEKEIIISFFCIRKLFEANKVSNKCKEYKAAIYSSAPRGKKITRLNQFSIDEVYDLEKEKIIIRLSYAITICLHPKKPGIYTILMLIFSGRTDG